MVELIEAEPGGHIRREDWPFLFFTPGEMACKCCGRLKIGRQLMKELTRIRTILDRPMIVSSGYRCPAHNAAVSSTGPNGPHTTGLAVDIRVYGAHALQLIQIATRYNASGIGINQRGPLKSRFVHIDFLPNGPGCPRPWVWSY